MVPKNLDKIWFCDSEFVWIFLENSVNTIFSKNQKFLTIIFLLTHVQNDFWPIKGHSIYQLYLVKNYYIAVLVFYPHIDLHLFFKKMSLKNQVGQTWLIKLGFSKINYCSIGGMLDLLYNNNDRLTIQSYIDKSIISWQ